MIARSAPSNRDTGEIGMAGMFLRLNAALSDWTRCEVQDEEE